MRSANTYTHTHAHIHLDHTFTLTHTHKHTHTYLDHSMNFIGLFIDTERFHGIGDVLYI